MIGFLKKYSSLTYIVIISIIVLIVPFIALCFFNYPSADDYYFAYKSEFVGIWKAQYLWYKEWTGRYFSTLILSFHPLLLHSFLLYKLICVAILLLSTYSIYKFFKVFITSENKSLLIFISLIVSFSFLNNMPHLPQGIYWAPGAITYQLANVMMLVFIANAAFLFNENTYSPKSRNTTNIFLIAAICGSNETSMMLMMALLFAFLIFTFIKNKKALIWSAYYFITGLVSSAIVYFSPGNKIRSTEYRYQTTNDISFTMENGLNTTLQYMQEWFSSGDLYILSSLFILSLVIYGGNEKIKKNGMLIIGEGILFLLIGILATFMIISLAYWATGIMILDRTLNVAFWIFTIAWFLFLVSVYRFIAGFISDKAKTLIGIPTFIILLVAISIMPFTIKGNYRLSLNDLFSGKALKYHHEFNNREKSVSNCTLDTCSAYAITNQPWSIFVSDLSYDINSWTNKTYSVHHKKSFVRLLYKEPEYLASYFYSFDEEINHWLDNQASITNEVSYSGKRSSRANTENPYTGNFKIPMKKISVKNIKDIFAINISLIIHCIDASTKPNIVCSIIDPQKESPVLWVSKEINPASSKWQEEFLTIPLNSRSFLKEEYILSIYVWNKGPGTTYIDDFKIGLY